MSLLCSFQLQSKSCKKQIPDLLIQINCKHTTFGSVDSTAILSQQHFKVLWKSDNQQKWDKVSPVLCMPKIWSSSGSAPAGKREKCSEGSAVAGYMDCSLLGSGRAGGELLPPQYMHIGDGASVPEMCERAVTQLLPGMRLRNTLSWNSPFTGSKFLEQNYS